MIRHCAWCDTPMGEVEPLDNKSVTHCICEKCQKELEEEEELEEGTK